METIIVGIDDSLDARRALRWAIDHARADDQVVALHVWQMPLAGGFDAAFLDPAVFEDDARKSADAVISEELAAAGVDPQRVETRVVQGHASGVLIEAGTSGDLLVLGSRGRGGFVGLVLGSVTSAVVNHAPCPVVVVPSTDD